MASLKKPMSPFYVLGSMAASACQASQSWSLLEKNPFILQLFLLRTVLETLLPNTCNPSLIHQKNHSFWGSVITKQTSFYPSPFFAFDP